MSQKTFRIIFWLLIISFIVISSIPNSALNRTVQADSFTFRLDYVLHFIAYLVIGVLAALAYKPNWKVFLLLIVFAMAEEGHQYWIPHRTMNPVDFMFDVLGLVVAMTGFYVKKYIRKQI
nr:VanZ family protein [Salinivirga cyanobacteriivorans]